MAKGFRPEGAVLGWLADKDTYVCSARHSFLTEVSPVRGAALLRFARKHELGDAVKVALLASGRVSENCWWLF